MIGESHPLEAAELERPEDAPRGRPLEGQRVLLHICCAPCATFTAQHLADQGGTVTGYWYNPNIHPYSEHELRRETLVRYADEISLPMLWEPEYEMPAFLRAVCRREDQGTRCGICYRIRLERAAQRAAELGFGAFTTTLLISPYQDLGEIGRIGHELGAAYGVSFHHQDLRQGFAEHYRLARQHDLYQQRYCGCVYSEWEARDRGASTRTRATAPAGNAATPAR